MANLVADALCTVADVKESLGIDAGDTSKDNLIKRKINQATAMIKGFTGRNFKEATYTEEYDATGTDQLILRQRPITSVTSLSSRDSSLNQNSFDTTDTELYFIDEDAGVLDLNFTAIGGWNRYQVIYVAGYEADNWPDNVPDDLREACVMLASFLVDNGTSGTNVKSKSEGQRKIEYFEAGQSSGDTIFKQLGIDDILNTYTNYPVIYDS